MLFGAVIAYPSPAQLDIDDDPNWSKIDTKGIEFTMFNAISSLTAIIGSLTAGALLNKAGRKISLAVTSLFSTSFWAFMTAIYDQDHFWAAILLRAFLGIVMGAFSGIVPVYIIELVPKEVSSFFGTFHQLGIAIGISIVYLIGNFINWHYLALFLAALSLVLCIAILFIPESPVAITKQNTISKTESICQKIYAKPLIVSIIMMFVQQFTGINAIITNMGSLLAGDSSSMTPGIASFISSAAQVVSVFIGAFFINWIGRKKAWVISSTGIATSLAIYACAKKFEWPTYVGILAMFLFLLFYGLGEGPIPCFIVPTLFPTTVSSIANSIAMASSWLFSFTVVFVFPELQKGLGEFGSMLFFAACTFGASIFGFFYITDIEAENEYDYISQDKADQ